MPDVLYNAGKRHGGFAMTDRRIPLVIDTDPGVDDTLAILLINAHRDKYDIRAINPVHGNVHYGDTSTNALRLAEYLNIDCRIGKGAVKPVVRAARTAGTVHGSGGLGGYDLPETDRQFDEKYAWDVLYEEAVKAGGELELVTLGPVTNVAIAFLAHPDLKNYIKKIYSMAGTAGKGNTNAFAEFNVYVDPEAFQILVSSGVPVYMCGLDGNASCGLSSEEILSLFHEESRVTDLTGTIASFIEDRNVRKWGMKINTIHDHVTMACYIYPEIAEFRPMHCSVELAEADAEGQTKVCEPDEDHPANIWYLVKADKQRYMEITRKMMKFYKLG